MRIMDPLVRLWTKLHKGADIDPPVVCPACGKLTQRADDGKCQHCGHWWSDLEKAGALPFELLQKKHNGFDYSSTHFLLPAQVSRAIQAFAASIPQGELSSDGRESTPHVTVKYGLHTQDGRKVAAAIQGQPTVPATLGAISLFPGAMSGKDYDVVKVDVNSPDLHKLNRYLCSKLPHVDTFSEYHPHITIAYVKAGEGAKYVGREVLPGVEMLLDHFIFSNRDREETPITLSTAPSPLRKRFLLFKARSVSGERRIPKGQPHGGEWAGTGLFSEDAAPAQAPGSKASKPIAPLPAAPSVPALSGADAKKVEAALKAGQAEITRSGTSYTLHVRPTGSSRKRKVGDFPSLNAARAQVLPSLGDSVIGYTDVGAKIGGARKDIAQAKEQFEAKPTADGLKRLEAEDPAAAAKSVTKAGLWKIASVEQMKSGGGDPHAVFLAHAIHSVIASKPDIDSESGRANYFAGIATIKRMVEGSQSFEAMADKVKGLYSDCQAVLKRQAHDRLRERYENNIAGLTERIKKPNSSSSLYDKMNLDRMKRQLAEMKKEEPKVTKYQAEMMLQMFCLGDRFRGLFGLPAKNGKGTAEMTIGGRKMNMRTLLTPWMEKKSGITNRYSDRATVSTAEEQWQAVRTSFGKADTLNAPVATATKERSADEQALYEERERLRAWERDIPTDYDRVGGKAIPIRRPEDYLRTFGLRGVEFGNWMDTESSRVHVERCAEAFSDLADAVGISARDLSMKGRLALAFGARGNGRGLAHYEPHKVVINLTKLGGVGSLAHEWGHFMDHMLQRIETNNSDSQTLLSDVVRATRKENRYDRNIVSPPVYSHANPVGLAMSKVMDEIMYGTGEASQKFTPDATKNRYRNWTTVEHAYNQVGGDTSKVMGALIAQSPHLTEKQITEAAHYLAAKFGVKSVDMPIKGISQYHLNMRLLDKVSGGSYYSSRCELFARCFESYVQDTLAKKKRHNNYLVRDTKGAGDGGMFDIYPRGEQRTKINAAMANLMDAVRETGALQKAFATLLDFPTLLKELDGRAAGRHLQGRTEARLWDVLHEHMNGSSAVPGKHDEIVKEATAHRVHGFFLAHPEHMHLHEDLSYAAHLQAGHDPHSIGAGPAMNVSGGPGITYHIKSHAHRMRLSDNFRKSYLLFKARKDTSGEARVPKGGKGAGEWAKSPSAAAAAAASPAPPADPALPKADPAAVQARGVYDLLVSKVHADPRRFQFKSGVSQITGAGEELRGVQKFDAELSGIISVWYDPANKKTYVVNGHHRLELAKRLRRRSVTVRYLDAPSAEKAMIKGALINIAEGRGTAVDAAKLFRQTKISKANLEAAGLSLKGSLAETATNLSSLCTVLWNKVVQGKMTPARGAVIGSAFTREPEQMALNAMLERPDVRKKNLSDEAIRELAKFVDTAGRRVKTIETLFGEESLVQNLAIEKAQVSAVLKGRLAADKRLFGYVSNSNRAARLESQGNKLESERNAAISQEAAQTEAVYDKLSRFSGPISDVLNAAAKEIASGATVKEAADRAYPKIREVVAGIATSRGAEHGGLVGSGSAERIHDPGPPGDGGMFGDEDLGKSFGRISGRIGVILLLRKGHDVSRETRVPKGGRGAGRWTAGGYDFAQVDDDAFDFRYRNTYLPGLNAEGLKAERSRVEAKASKAKPDRADYWKNRLAWISEAERAKKGAPPPPPKVTSAKPSVPPAPRTSPPAKPTVAPTKPAATRPAALTPARTTAPAKTYPPIVDGPRFMEEKASDAAVTQYKATLSKLGLADGGIHGADTTLKTGGYRQMNDDGYQWTSGGRKVTAIQAQRRAAFMAKNALLRLNSIVKIDGKARKGKPALRIHLGEMEGAGSTPLSRVAAAYSPGQNAIELDSRHPTSLFHEYGHYLDYSATQGIQSSLSLPATTADPDWKKFTSDLARTDEHHEFLQRTSLAANYASDPKEVFARFFEAYVVHELKKKGVDGDAYTSTGHRNRAQGGFFTYQRDERWTYEQLDTLGARMRRLLRSKGLLKNLTFLLTLFKANPNQPRVPKGRLGGGQWTRFRDGHVQINPVALGATTNPGELSKRAAAYAREHFFGKHYVNEATNHDITVSNRGIKKVTSGRAERAKILAVVAIPDMIRHASYLGQAPDEKGRRNVKAFHYYEVPVQIGEESFAARLTIMETNEGKLYYYHALTELKPAGTSQRPSGSPLGTHAPAAGSDDSISKSASIVNVETPFRSRLSKADPDPAKAIKAQVEGATSSGTAQRRAKVNGEIGANHEAYKRGQFIATSPETIKGALAKVKRLGATGDSKQQIEPYKYEFVPLGKKALMSQWSTSFVQWDPANMGKVRPLAVADSMFTQMWNVAPQNVAKERRILERKQKEFCARWNKGERILDILAEPQHASPQDIARYVAKNQAVPAPLMDRAKTLLPGIDFEKWNRLADKPVAKSFSRLIRLVKSHDVSGEPRDDSGRWTIGGGLPRASAEEVAHARSLGIKIPATVWGLKINPDPDSKVAATWRDQRGRSQSVYRQHAVEARKDKIFGPDLRSFADALPQIRKKVAEDLKQDGTSIERACAAIVALIDQTTMRVGSEKYVDDNATFGASSLRKVHVSVSGRTVKCTFAGKHHKEHEKVADDPALAEAVRTFMQLPGDRVFQAKGSRGLVPVTETRVLDYLAPFGVTPKQFRTYHATRMAREILAGMGVPKDESTAKKNIVECCKRVAAHLGNTPAMARSSYIDPAIFHAYLHDAGVQRSVA